MASTTSTPPPLQNTNIKRKITLAIFIVLIQQATTLCQVSLKMPDRWHKVAPLASSSRAGPPEKALQALRRDLLNTNLVRTVAKFSGLSEMDLAGLVVAPGLAEGEVWLYQIGSVPNTAFESLRANLEEYVRGRVDGHTPAYLWQVLTGGGEPVADPFAKLLISNRTWVVAAQLKQTGSGTSTNKAGETTSALLTYRGGTNYGWTTNTKNTDEISRWVRYVGIDGEIVWQYTIYLKPDNSLDHIEEHKCDAKDYDPAYQAVIRQVEEEVSNELRRNNAPPLDSLTSLRLFWRLKQQKLKDRGLNWRTPAELNPQISF